MKNKFLFLLIIGLPLYKTAAQQPDSSPPAHPHKVKYTVSLQLKGNEKRIGSLYSTSDSSLVLAKTNQWFLYNITSLESIPIGNIEVIKAKKRNGATKGALTGMGAGAVIGGFIGYFSYKNDPQGLFGYFKDVGPGIHIAGGALLGVPAGAIIGTTAGKSIRKTFPIHGNLDTYAAQREKLKRLSITGQ